MALLREALVVAAESVIAERGVDGFSLREARAGRACRRPRRSTTSVTRAGLLTAVAVAAFIQLGDALEAALAGAGRTAAPASTRSARPTCASRSTTRRVST
jgi:hypothetical protein